MSRATKLRTALISFVVLVLASTISPISPANAGEVDRDQVEQLHDALVEAKKDGMPVEGDISVEALTKELEGGGIKPYAGDGCSTPKATKKIAEKYDKMFINACNKHDVCYMANSKTDRKVCDKTFQKDMNARCMKLPYGSEKPCLTAANIYYLAVRAGGKSSYKRKGKNN